MWYIWYIHVGKFTFCFLLLSDERTPFSEYVQYVQRATSAGACWETVYIYGQFIFNWTFLQFLWLQLLITDVWWTRSGLWTVFRILVTVLIVWLKLTNRFPWLTIASQPSRIMYPLHMTSSATAKVIMLHYWGILSSDGIPYGLADFFFLFLLPPLNMTFSEAKHNRTSINFFRCSH